MSRLDHLDQEIARWENVAAATVNNVYALYEHPAYRVLAGVGASAPPPPLTGRTAAEIGPAVQTVGELLARALELKKVIERAAALRRDLPLLFRDERLAEIEALLHGPSIALPPADPLPLADRGLLAGVSDPQAAPPAITPEQLVEHMKGSFETSRDRLFAVDRAWSTLPGSLDAVEADLRELETLAEPLGPHAPAARAALDEIRREAPAVRAALRSDPLGAAEALERRVAPRLQAARAGFEGVARQWREAQSELAGARALATESTEVHARAVAACAERQAKVAVAGPAPPEPAPGLKVADLARWLERLSEKLTYGTGWPPARIGLARWRAEATETLRLDRAALDAAEALLRERQSLRGLLEALNAKAAARGLAEHPELAGLSRETRELLWTRPTPIELARQRVADLGNRLRAGVV